jgi:hypothetical protein
LAFAKIKKKQMYKIKEILRFSRRVFDMKKRKKEKKFFVFQGPDRYIFEYS